MNIAHVLGNLDEKFCENLRHALAIDLIHPKQKDGVLKFLNEKTYESFTRNIRPISRNELFEKSYFSYLIEKLRGSGIKFVATSGTASQNFAGRFLSEADNDNFKCLSESVMAAFDLKDLPITINCYPMGVTLPSTLPNFEIGPRTNALSAALDTVPNNCKTLIIGQHHFLHRCFTDGLINSKNWENTYFIAGGTWYPSNYYDFVATTLSVSISDVRKKIANLYGLSEVGIGIGLSHNSRFDSINPEFKKIRTNFLLETQNDELLVSNATGRVPVLRYRTGDPAVIDSNNNSFQIGLKNRLNGEILALVYSDPNFAKITRGVFRINENEILFPYCAETLNGDFPLFEKNLKRFGRSVSYKIGEPNYWHKPNYLI